jgi:hypothetical protein
MYAPISKFSVMVMRVNTPTALRHHRQAFSHQVPGTLALDALAQVFDVAFAHTGNVYR